MHPSCGTPAKVHYTVANEETSLHCERSFQEPGRGYLWPERDYGAAQDGAKLTVGNIDEHRITAAMTAVRAFSREWLPSPSRTR